MSVCLVSVHGICGKNNVVDAHLLNSFCWSAYARFGIIYSLKYLLHISMLDVV